MGEAAVMDTLKLDTAVGLLTRRSHHMIKDPHTGAYYPVLAEPLLVQLALAAMPSSSTDGGGSSSITAPLPLNADAHDLLQRIRDEAASFWWEAHKVHRGAGRRTLVGHITGWVAVARQDEESLKVAEKVVCRWVAEIETLFNPQRRRPLPGAACPNKDCGATRVLDREELGEHFYKPALSKLYDNEGDFTRLECGACGESWEGMGLELMAP